jgi:signal transduction histidine kinase
MVKEDTHHIWLCTENGLLLYNDIENNYKRFIIPDSQSSVATKDFISNTFIDSEGNHWIFPWRSGIWKLDVSLGTFTKQIDGLIRENNEWKGLVVTSAAEDGKKNIWFADLDEGLILYEASTGKFSKPTEKYFGARYMLPNVMTDKQYVWGVKTGIVFAIDIYTNHLHQWPLPAGFNKQVNGFSGDKYNNLWIETTGGIVLFNRATHAFKRYTADDGLPETVLKGSLYPLNDGRMLYAFNNYITEFDALKMSAPGIVPKVMITEISSQNKLLHPQNTGGQKRIELDHNYNNFRFRWAVMNYSNPLQNTFYCKLEGIDKDWRFTGYKGEVQYASLSPGKYTLRVKGASADGIMNETGDSLEIIILPPVWQRWWFVFSSIALVFIILVLVVRYISQRNLKEKLLKLEKEQAVEKERNRISRDMHDDLGSGLTKIAIMSEVVKKQLNEPEKAREQLETISISSRELVDNLQNIIWVLNTRYDTLETLASYIREYALRYFEPFEISIHFNYPDQFPHLKLSEEQRRNIFLVSKETFHNISKHASCSNVTVSMQCIGNRVHITIKDDGKGFNMNDVRQFGNGLMNMQNRVHQVGGSFTISSSPGEGCITTMDIPV